MDYVIAVAFLLACGFGLYANYKYHQVMEDLAIKDRLLSEASRLLAQVENDPKYASTFHFQTHCFDLVGRVSKTL